MDLPRGVRGRARETCAIFHHYADTMVGLAGSYVLLFLLALLPISPLIFLSSLLVCRVVSALDPRVRIPACCFYVSSTLVFAFYFCLSFLRAFKKPNYFFPSFYLLIASCYIQLIYTRFLQNTAKISCVIKTLFSIFLKIGRAHV